jgi:hypothetical protein
LITLDTASFHAGFLKFFISSFSFWCFGFSLHMLWKSD